MRLKTIQDYIFVVALTTTSLAIHSQDTLKLASEISYEVKGQHVVAAISKDFNCFNCGTKTVSDNPFNHNAYYAGIRHMLTLNDNYTIETGLYMEERSFSGGNNTLLNLKLFPKILIKSLDTVRLFNKHVEVRIKGGDYWNEDVNDILRFYNIDYQAVQVNFGMGSYSAGLFVIADLSSNIGFELHELYRFSLGYESGRIKNFVSLSRNLLRINPESNPPTPSDHNLTEYFRVDLKNGAKLESQLDLRMNPVSGLSFALGAKAELKKENFRIVTALKYYQSKYNQGYRSSRPQYRYLGNYVGSQLYPLKNYYRDFGQWATFTNFQNMNLLGLDIIFDWSKTVYKKIGVFTDISFNVIADPVNKESYIYPLYNLGFKINFLKSLQAFVSVTNKHMNLDSFYQGVYASEKPFLSYGLKMNLDELKLKTRYVVI